MFDNPLIFHFSSKKNLGPGHGGSRLRRVFQAFISQAMLSCSSLGIPRCSEKRRYIIPPAISGSTLGSPPSGLAQENLQRELPRRHPNQMTKPPQLTSFNTKEQWLSFELTLNVPAPHPVPVTLWRKLISDIFFLK